MTRKVHVLCANIQAGATTRRTLDYIVRSWSVWLPFGKSPNIDAIAALAQRHDVVGLQESDAGSIRSGFSCQAQAIGQRAAMPHTFRQINREIGLVMASGNAVVGRYVPVSVRSVPLPSRIRGRGMLIVEYMLEDGSRWTVAVVHLSLRATTRHKQAAAIAKTLEGAKNPLLMGDFNCSINAPEMQVLFEATPLCKPRASICTYPAWSPHRALDHILIGGGLRMEKIRSVVVGGSDHLALSATLTLPSPIASL